MWVRVASQSRKFKFREFLMNFREIYLCGLVGLLKSHNYYISGFEIFMGNENKIYD